MHVIDQFYRRALSIKKSIGKKRKVLGKLIDFNQKHQTARVVLLPNRKLGEPESKDLET